MGQNYLKINAVTLLYLTLNISWGISVNLFAYCFLFTFTAQKN